MPPRLERHYDTCSAHFITCSCYRRKPLLADDRIKQVFLAVLEETSRRYRFCVYGYVLMPEHFHLIIGRPEVGDTGKVLQVLKQRVSHGARKILGPTLSQKTGKDGAPCDVARSNPSEWEIVGPTLSQKMGKDGAPTDVAGCDPSEWEIVGPTLSQKTGKDGAPTDVAGCDPSEWEIVDPTLSQKTGKDGAPVMLRVPTRASGRDRKS